MEPGHDNDFPRLQYGSDQTGINLSFRNSTTPSESKVFHPALSRLETRCLGKAKLLLDVGSREYSLISDSSSGLASAEVFQVPYGFSAHIVSGSDCGNIGGVCEGPAEILVAVESEACYHGAKTTPGHFIEVGGLISRAVWAASKGNGACLDGWGGGKTGATRRIPSKSSSRCCFSASFRLASIMFIWRMISGAKQRKFDLPALSGLPTSGATFGGDCGAFPQSLVWVFYEFAFRFHIFRAKSILLSLGLLGFRLFLLFMRNQSV
ncbi:hypothetical protein FS749_000537 [Ceratobasidium sp. UAMH 11750]|nr:hypothetical protein FS749_000537 [Ceratobasidium sp. UAMH 11750]